jgi:hypothetical protein
MIGIDNQTAFQYDDLRLNQFSDSESIPTLTIVRRTPFRFNLDPKSKFCCVQKPAILKAAFVIVFTSMLSAG